jgi:hypothetical protein
VNVFIVFPVLAVSALYVHEHSVRAFMVWLGALIYVVYSYLMYAFFVHFGPVFPLFVGVLGDHFDDVLVVCRRHSASSRSCSSGF